MSVDYKARYEALRKLIVEDRDAQYADKVIYPCNGPDYQNWKVELRFPDPLPENYAWRDLDKPRLTLAEAVDRCVAALEQVAAIPNRLVGPDWEEIDEARTIALMALADQPAAAPQSGRMRGLFENYLRSDWAPGYACPRDPEGEYLNGEAHRHWLTWQAAVARVATCARGSRSSHAPGPRQPPMRAARRIRSVPWS